MKKGLAIIVTAATVLAACSPMNSKSSSSPSPSPAMMENNGMDTSGTEPMEKTTTMSNGVMVGGALMTPDKDIVDNAMNSKDHTTLVAAVKAAGLVETLKGSGPYTVFAPTNAAFEKLPAGTVKTLLKPENKAKLTSILTYHVVPGAITSADLTNGKTLKTVNGQTIKFTEKDGKWYINDTTMITISDVMSSNGVTYVVDSVLMPK